MSGKQRFILGLVGVIAAALFAVFVWPSIWEYREQATPFGTHLVRINRITGQTETLR